MQRVYITVADNLLKAAQEKKFDYPAGNNELKTRDEIVAALKNGKTIEEVYLQCIARFGSITGGVMNSILGHASQNTIAAVRKGCRMIIGNE